MSTNGFDEDRVAQFIGQVIGDLGAGVSGALARIGHRLGLYRAMAGAGPVTPAELAERTGTVERYVREWLANQAAGGYVTYDPAAARYALPAEHALVLADEDSPAYMAGAFDTMAATWAVHGRVERAFQTGEGVGWHEQDPLLFAATECFFAPQYRANLVPVWIPALDGVEARLEAGARVADVGCGHGVTTILLAQAYPNAELVGFDYHEASVEVARKRAVEAGVGDRVEFKVASATDFPGEGYDLVCFFDALHDTGDPVAAAAHTRQGLAGDGTVLLVEPYAADRVEDNLNPLGRVGYGMSTLVCTPGALSQPGGMALGAQAGEAESRCVFEQAGFSRFRRAAETPVHLVFEARP
ncbi:class I SAM-dependent methyltransferase [Egibacter rhizosphaerae]|uniref:Class I SAM-dependent methyltransferase n=1 Tax=Egibacter rhizosphaerae TaxID=1670831 RepID=A0A411YBD7_9ACTN|nr:class I SAM-dependent methyltransferase [Egibacter rhizosphaerae]QBI18506.1 class I SAM-dependent methyltransferase [Egibacter rhizosphaerae]